MSDEATLDEFVEDEEKESHEFVETAAGKIPVDWDTVNVEKLCELRNGKATDHTDIGEQQYLVYGSNGPIGSYSKSNFDGGLIFGRVGAVGKVERIRESVWVSDNAIQAIVSDKCNTDYLYYFLSSKELASLATKTAQPLLNQSTIGNVSVPSPPLPEQRKIATVLYTVDRAIEKTEEVIDQLFKIRRGTIRELLTSGFPSDSGTEINIGPNQYCYPSDWEVVALSELIDIKSGNYFPAEDFCERGIRCLKIDNVHYGRIIWENETHLPESYLDEYSDLVLEEGDILLALNRPITNNQVKVGMMDDSDAPALLYQRVGKLIPNERIRDEFLIYALSEGPFKHQLERRLVGSDQPYINKSQLQNIKIPVPSLQVQDEIVEHVSSIDANFTAEKVIIERLNRLKQGLQQDLLSGTVRTTDTNIEVPDEIAQHG